MKTSTIPVVIGGLGLVKRGKSTSTNSLEMSRYNKFKVCPLEKCSYPKEEFIHHINHFTLMKALSSRDEVSFISE